MWKTLDISNLSSVETAQMKSTADWIKDWRCGLNANLEERVSEGLIDIFQDFWAWADMDSKSKTTQRRYSAALHALGGYLVQQVGTGTEVPATVQEFLSGYIDSGDGPLIYHDNEAWQNELDAVCRKLHKYLTK